MINKYYKLADETLVEYIIKHDKQAFEIIVKRYQTRIAGLVGRYLQDGNEISDVTQEIFLRAYCALKQFRGESSFSTWLYRITVNYLKNILLTQQRRIHIIGFDLEYFEQHLGKTLSKENTSPEQIMLYEQVQQTINTIINGLGDEIKLAFILREMEGLSYEAIAEILQCPLGTVRSRIYRAREAMASAFEQVIKD